MKRVDPILRYVEHMKNVHDVCFQLNSDAKERFGKYILEALFSTWDIDGKGYVELPHFISVAEKYKGGAEQEALELGG